MKFIGLYIIVICLLVCIHPAQALEMRLENEKLWLHAENTPLQEILHTMAARNIKVQVDPRLDPLISADMKGVPLQKALTSLLGTASYSLIWEKSSANGAVRLAEIQVFEKGKKNRMRPLQGKGNFDVVRNPEDGTYFVRDELLLRRKPGVSGAEFEKLLKNLDAIILEKNTALGLYRVRLPAGSDIPALVKAISGNGGAADAEPNYAWPVNLPYKTGTAGYAGYVNPNPPDGGVPVAVLDSGLLPDSGLDDYVVASLDAVSPENSISDGLGHGTQMALIASGAINPAGAEADGQNPLIPVRAFDDNGVTSSFSIMESIDFALENGAKVLSLSWGSETQSDFMEQAMQYADSKGLIVVAAAGNEATGTSVYPAAYSTVIGVGALAPDGTRWENSNYGNSVTLSAPGFADLPVGYKGEAGAYAGTSIATAFVANAAAAYINEHPEASKAEVVQALSSRFNP